MDEPQETHVNPRSYTLAKKYISSVLHRRETGIGVDAFFRIKLVAKGKFPTLSPSVDNNNVIEDSTLKGEDHPRVKRCDQGLEIEGPL